jgi:5-methylthioadenosine/S-adenosylhomocysteine deaminase
VKIIDLLVVNANIITMDNERRILKEHGIAVQGDTIIEISSSDVLIKKYEGKKVIDAKGKYIFPGMINTHNHMFQVLFKGIGKEKALIKWLEEAIQKPYFNITVDDIYLAAMVSCIEQIKSGVTTVVDYQYAHGQPYLNDAVCQAMEDIGIRGILARGYTQSSGFPKYTGTEIIETEEDFIRNIRRIQRLILHWHLV